jgi:hypothetical protein
MTEQIAKSLLELNFAGLTRRTFTLSPAAWEDQVLYFLLLDRFSDGREKDGYQDIAGRPVSSGTIPLYRPEDPGRVDYDTWLRAGGGWQGGTLKGLKSKLGYLRRLGITALWVSPPFRQVAFEASYHGYGIQNFLDIAPHFGTREEFRDFVRAAHEQGIYVILDIIAHHTRNVFSYNPDRYMTHDPVSGWWYNDPRWDGKPYAVQGFNDKGGRPTLPFDMPDGARLVGASAGASCPLGRRNSLIWHTLLYRCPLNGVQEVAGLNQSCPRGDLRLTGGEIAVAEVLKADVRWPGEASVASFSLA